MQRMVLLSIQRVFIDIYIKHDKLRLFLSVLELSLQISLPNVIQLLSGNVCKSGPLHLGSQANETSFVLGNTLK